MTKQADFILLDRSGSMSGIWQEAISSINAYVENLVKEKVKTKVTLACFDKHDGVMSFDILRDGIKPTDWKTVADNEVSPRGMTPLNDATAKLLDKAEAGDYKKVAVIIMTDGEENSSVEFRSVALIKARLDKVREKGWAVVFLGANFDNVHQAAGYGTHVGATLNAAPGNMAAAMATMASSRGMYASGATQDMSFSDQDRATLKTPKPATANATKPKPKKTA